MNNENQEYYHHPRNNAASVLVGALVGGLAGAAAMLLFAPQSGEETRAQIQEKGVELRDRTNAMVKDAVDSVRSNANRITTQGREKIEETFEDLKHQGQDLAVEQLDRVSAAAKAGKKAIKNS